MTSPPKPPAAPAAQKVPHSPAFAPQPLVPLRKFATVLADVVSPRAQPAQAPALPAQRGQVAEHATVPAPERKRHDVDQALDPIARQAAQLGPPPTIAARVEPERASEARAQMSLEDLVPQLVKKIAWSGDARQGTVHMELGAGELAGSSLTVTAHEGRISVQLRAPVGTDVAQWKERLATRLGARGLDVDSVEVS